MAERTGKESSLVRLSDSDFHLEEPEQDVRGLDIYDREGKQIGSVKDLYVDREERKVRFLDVGADGFLGIGEKHIMIPVEAITGVGEDRVAIEQGREKVAGSPPFDTEVVPPTTDYQREIYGHYGYTPTCGPLWLRWRLSFRGKHQATALGRVLARGILIYLVGKDRGPYPIAIHTEAGFIREG
ncbi:MAG: PRC-barrel domain-containing protein [Actinomycetota bacterium]|nr:PRC-barrel domain-containing protein [Actinomycetota bacterium]